MTKSKENKIISGGTTNLPHSGPTANTGGMKDGAVKHITSENKNIISDSQSDQRIGLTSNKLKINNKSRGLSTDKFLNLNTLK
jgi:hypothetical protein